MKTTTTDMFASLRAEHDIPKFVSRHEAKQQVLNVADFALQMQQQLAELRRHLVTSESKDTEGGYRGAIEFIHQSIGRVEKDAALLMEISRRCSTGLHQIHRSIMALDTAETASPTS